jgi:ferredoxin
MLIIVIPVVEREAPVGTLANPLYGWRRKTKMTYVVAEPCVNCRYTDCALVCPVDAFHLDDDMLVIHPETCIDCDACVPECPVEAIFAENNVPPEWTHFTPLNAERALSGLPTISARLDPLCEAK